jgi:hypothetical protein
MGVRENLVALGRSVPAHAAPPAAAAQPDADVDATAEWLDFDRRPKPDPNFLITPVED